MKVRLTIYEVYTAAMIGVLRQIESMKNGKRDAHGFDNENLGSYEIGIRGACGELVFAKATGMYWPPSVNTYKEPDVGNIEVRTRSKHHYDLIVRPGDSDDKIFALVTGIPIFCGVSGPEYRVVGWILGRHAKRDEWLEKHGGRQPAYFVPQRILSPISELF